MKFQLKPGMLLGTAAVQTGAGGAYPISLEGAD